MDDEYYTIRNYSLVETKVQGSRFLGETVMAESPEDVQAKLADIRKREHAASHHCFAWQIGRGQHMSFKYSDDGEPNGTAGRPIYDALTGADVTNALVTVTRYFGGTKLGTGGLARAYKDAAQLSLEKAGRVTQYVTATLGVGFNFSLYERWMIVLNKMGATVLDSQFSDKVDMKLCVRLSRLEELKRTFVELTSGKGQIEVLRQSEAS